MSFEDFSNMFTPSNPLGKLKQLPLSRGGPGPDQMQTASSQQKSFPGGLYAKGGLAKILEV